MSMTILTEFGLIFSNDIILSPSKIKDRSDAEIIKAIREMQRLLETPLYAERQRRQGDDYYASISDFFAGIVKPRSIILKQSQLVKLAKRRALFESRKEEFKQALIERDTFICAWPGCFISKYLTIDHITPISKGGTDDLSNLRFLCRGHNSVKGNRLITCE